MTDLEKSLIAIGAVIVAGVFLYNKWQEYKTKKNVERAFSSTHDDVLMNPAQAPAVSGSGRHEPSFDDERTQEDAQRPHADETDHQIGTVVANADEFFVPKPKDLPVDDMIDCTIPMALAAKVRGDKILRALNALRIE